MICLNGCPYYMEIGTCVRHGSSGECMHPTCDPANRFRMAGGCSRAPSKVRAQWEKDCSAAKQAMAREAL